MGIAWVDLTIPMAPGMTVWPGDPPFELEAKSRMARGAGCNASLLRLGTHTGTHVDAPWHFDDAGAGVDEIDPALFFGEATVIELPDVRVVTAVDLGESRLPARVLVKTRNSSEPDDGRFREDYVGFSPDAARRCVEEGVRLLGVDGPSVGRFGGDGEETHRILLGHNVPVVEGLRLEGVPGGVCQFVVLPLRIAGGDGAPCRAFAGLEDRV